MKIGIYDSALIFLNEVLKEADAFKSIEPNEKKIYDKEVSTTHYNIGFANYNMGNYPEALDYYRKSLKIDQDLNDKTAISKCLGSIGIVYMTIGDNVEALDYYFKALKIAEEQNDKSGIAMHSSNIGTVYFNTEKYPEALNYYFKALTITKEPKNNISIYNSIGNVYSKQGDYTKAKDYYERALKIAERIEDISSQGLLIGNIAIIYDEQGNDSLALFYYAQALIIAERGKNRVDIARHLGNIGAVYTEQKKYALAESYLLKALSMEEETGYLDGIKGIHFHLSELYEKINKPTKALWHYKQYTIAKDSLFNIEKNEDVVRKQMNFDFAKKEANTKAEQDKKNALATKEKQQQRIIVYITSTGLLLFLILTLFIYRGYSQKKKLSLNLYVKNQEITDSINYAKRIQEAILPVDDEFKSAFPDSFVLYKPKDIVSGDFYWISINPDNFSIIEKTDEGNWNGMTPLIAAVDCTGHGVPGSLMSMLGNSLLNKIVDTNKIRKPSEILNSLRNEIINSLQQHSGNKNRDGMDIALCAVHEDKIEFAGANNPIYIIRKNGSLEKIRGDKMPIGYSDEELKPFTNHSINIEKGDCFYIFTDGYADQFGGKFGKKFKYKQMEELLCSVHDKSMDEQKQILNSAIESWQGLTEQTDDILIIGLKR